MSHSQDKKNESLKYDKKSAIQYNKNLQYSNKEWRLIQHTLNKVVDLDSKLETDGKPGPLTTDAVYSFQKQKKMKLLDGKLGPTTSKTLGIPESKKTEDKQPEKETTAKDGKVSIPSGSKIMSTSYTPDLDLLNKHATQNGYKVNNIKQSAEYVAKYCTGGSSQHQCTRGTSLFLQLASYARGEADRKYKSSCAANLFGSAYKLTKFNISSSVANEYMISSSDNKTGKTAMNKFIASKLKNSGDFVTFKYAKSQHIVFHANNGWYSDFKQGTPAGCGSESTTYSDIHYFNT